MVLEKKEAPKSPKKKKVLLKPMEKDSGEIFWGRVLTETNL